MDAHLVSFNAAMLALAEEILWLPTDVIARTATDLLYRSSTPIPDQFLAHVGRGSRLTPGDLLASAVPLGVVLASRLGPSAAWRDGATGLKSARMLARERYRQLQTAFLGSAARVAPEASEALVRYTYGTQGRHWLWADHTKRILDRVVTANRAALGLVVAVACGASTATLRWGDGAPPVRIAEMSGDLLDVLAEALLPVAVPDFERIAGALVAPQSPLAGDEALTRYHSLFSEMLGLAAHPEAHS